MGSAALVPAGAAADETAAPAAFGENLLSIFKFRFVADEKSPLWAMGRDATTEGIGKEVSVCD